MSIEPNQDESQNLKVAMPVGTYLTDLPPRPKSDLAVKISPSEIFSLPKCDRQSFLPSLPTRPGSAAPVIEPLASTATLERESISRMARRRNLELHATMDIFLRAGVPLPLQPSATGGVGSTSSGASLSLDELMSKLQKAQRDENSKYGVGTDSPKKRKSLMTRTTEMSREGRSTTREETEKKLATLRNDFGSRLLFFQHVREMQQLKLEARRERGSEVMHRNALLARCNTPQEQQRRLESICSDRDTHAASVRERKEALAAEKKQMFETMVRRANRTGVQLGDPVELELERQAALLTSSWRTVVHLGFRANVWFMGLLDARKEQLRKAAEMEERREVLLGHFDKIVFLQRFFKRRLKRKLIRKKIVAAKLIMNFLSAVPRIQYQFRKGVRRMLHRVVSIQRHFRSIGVVRQMRRDEGVKRVDDYIRQLVTKIDNSVTKLQRERKRVESQASMAIKVRKPLFEAQATQLQESIIQLSKRKFMLAALREESKREVVGAVLKMREEAYQMRLRAFGKEIHDKYMIEFNLEKVLRDRQRDIDDEIEHQSFVQVKTVSVWTLKRQAMLKKVVRPVMCIHISAADVADLFDGFIPDDFGLSPNVSPVPEADESERAATLNAKAGDIGTSSSVLSGNIRDSVFLGSLAQKSRDDFQKQNEVQFGHR